MEVQVYNQAGKAVGTVELPKAFDAPLNRDLLHQVAVSQEGNARRATAHAKGRGEVRGGGKKPWKQKGTGRARHGSIRSPLWKGGGVTHGPLSERNFKNKINKKMARIALAMTLGAKARAGALVVIDALTLDGKTKSAARVMKALADRKELKKMAGATKLVLLSESAATAKRAFRNIENTDVLDVSRVAARDVLANAYVMMPRENLAAMESRTKTV